MAESSDDGLDLHPILVGRVVILGRNAAVGCSKAVDWNRFDSKSRHVLNAFFFFWTFWKRNDEGWRFFDVYFNHAGTM